MCMPQARVRVCLPRVRVQPWYDLSHALACRQPRGLRWGASPRELEPRRRQSDWQRVGAPAPEPPREGTWAATTRAARAPVQHEERVAGAVRQDLLRQLQRPRGAHRLRLLRPRRRPPASHAAQAAGAFRSRAALPSRPSQRAARVACQRAGSLHLPQRSRPSNGLQTGFQPAGSRSRRVGHCPPPAGTPSPAQLTHWPRHTAASPPTLPGQLAFLGNAAVRPLNARARPWPGRHAR